MKSKCNKFSFYLFPSFRDKLRHRRDSCRGATMVEAALVLPLLFLLVGAAVDFSLYHFSSLMAHHAAREGARQGATMTSFEVSEESQNFWTVTAQAVTSKLPPAGLLADAMIEIPGIQMEDETGLEVMQVIVNGTYNSVFMPGLKRPVNASIQLYREGPEPPQLLAVPVPASGDAPEEWTILGADGTPLKMYYKAMFTKAYADRDGEMFGTEGKDGPIVFRPQVPLLQ